MHELSLSQSIVSTALAASHVPPERVTAIAVEVGALSAVNVSSLDFCLRLTLEERGMERTRVSISRVPALVECECGHRYEPADVFSPCPRCGKGCYWELVGRS